MIGKFFGVGSEFRGSFWRRGETIAHPKGEWVDSDVHELLEEELGESCFVHMYTKDQMSGLGFTSERVTPGLKAEMNSEGRIGSLVA